MPTVYDSTQTVSAAARNAVQAYSAQSTGNLGSASLFGELLQTQMRTQDAQSGISAAADSVSPRLQDALSESINGAWKSVAQMESEAAAAEAEEAAQAEASLSSLLPMLLMGMMGSTGGSSGVGASYLMMAMMLALSSERGRSDLSSGIGNAFASRNVSYNVNSMDGVRAYAAAAGSSASVGGVRAGAAADTAAGAFASVQSAANDSARAATASSASAAQQASAAEKARFDEATKLISDAGNRSPELYRQIIDQFDVENNPRYAPRDGKTYCNIFQWDVTKAMGAEIPHYTNATTGAPTSPDDPDVRFMNANRISKWLNTLGEQYGWYEVSAEQAQMLANKGHPAVTIWKNNSGGHGHCQIVSPSKDGGYDPVKGVAIAQAGRLLKNYDYITSVYSSTLPEVQYFAHK